MFSVRCVRVANFVRVVHLVSGVSDVCFRVGRVVRVDRVVCLFVVVRVARVVCVVGVVRVVGVASGVVSRMCYCC